MVRKFAKGVNTSDAFAVGECGRHSLAVTYMTQAIKY